MNGDLLQEVEALQKDVESFGRLLPESLTAPTDGFLGLIAVLRDQWGKGFRERISSLEKELHVPFGRKWKKSWERLDSYFNGISFYSCEDAVFAPFLFVGLCAILVSVLGLICIGGTLLLFGRSSFSPTFLWWVGGVFLPVSRCLFGLPICTF